MKDRPKLVRVSEDMKRWAALLESEISSWPHVSSKAMFGMTGIYRKKTIFAALPKTRAMSTANSVAFKLLDRPPAIDQLLNKDQHIPRPGRNWIAFEMRDDKDLNAALKWLERAYARATATKPPKEKKKVAKK